MCVVSVRNVGMGMTPRLVPVQMAVRSFGHGVVRVVVMLVVVPVRVLMLDWLVHMFMGVRLRQMECHAGEHQRTTRGHAPAQAAIA